MAKILIADAFSSVGTELLQSTPGLEVQQVEKATEEELCRLVADVDAIIVRSATKITPRILEAATRCKLVGRAGIGVDNIAVPAASRRGVLVMNAPSGNSITTAEHAVSLLMSLARKIPQATASMRQGKWEKNRFMGMELFERTLGIVGLGNIGRIVAERARGLGMKVIALDPFMTPEAAAELGVELVDKDDLLRRSDAITIHAPLTNHTKNLFDAAAFEKMKRTALLINAARGGIIDEKALFDALSAKRIAGAALDVFEVEPTPADNPLLQLDNLICTPHLGASTNEAQDKVAIELAQQFADFFTTGTIRNAINLPAVRGGVPPQAQAYIQLGERLGRFHAQVFGGFTSVEVLYAGEAFADMPALPLVTSAVVQGLLEAALDVPVNLVNAPLLAAEHGIKVKESRTTAKGTFSSLVSIRLERGSEKSEAQATLFAHDDARLVALDGVRIECELAGRLLFITNEDKPGVIGNVGTVLGSSGINVARLAVGLSAPKKQAVALWNVDAPVTDAVLATVAKLPNVTSAKLVTL